MKFRKRRSTSLSSNPKKSNRARKDPPDEQVYDCIVVQMHTPSQNSAGSRSPLPTLSSNSINSSNTVSHLNTPTSHNSNQRKLKVPSPPSTLAPESKVRVPNSRSPITRSKNRRKAISPTVRRLKASAEREVHLISLYGEDLIGRRRSRRIAEGPRANYVELPSEYPLSADDNQSEELTNDTTPQPTKSSTAANSTDAIRNSTSKPAGYIQPKRNKRESSYVIPEIQSVDSHGPSTPRARTLRSSTYLSRATKFGASRSISTTSIPKPKRRTIPVPRVPKVHPADKYPSYLGDLLRDRIYDKEVTANKEKLVFDEEGRQRGWNVEDERVPPHDAQ
ncbi:hypothetical protein EV426DRAFT_616555 [Tirmania nivea]|nr:hypothetical protein EV426DRAFT_616555 [Tirmania nivea]